MDLRDAPSYFLKPRDERSESRGWAAVLFALAALPMLLAGAVGGQDKVDVLRIGSSIAPVGETQAKKEQAARDTLKAFIKDETGLANEIAPQQDWRRLADKMAKGELHLGVFQGYEFAWAQQEFPKLTPLAIAVNVNRYPVAYVMVKSTNAARDFAGLKGQSLSIPAPGARFLRLFVDHECAARGAKAEAFFSKITTPDEIEDALDAVVDGDVNATVVDRAALEAYKRKKPGRFKMLYPAAQSQPFPPPVVAYYGTALPEATRAQFRDGLLGASEKEKGQQMLTLFRLTGFERVPADFEKVLDATRKNYPPPSP